MRPFRDPFSLETAEGFPVDGLHPSSRLHARRGLNKEQKSDDVKNGAINRNPEKTKENGV